MPQAMKERVAGLVERMLALIEQEREFEASLRLAEWLARYLTGNAAGIYRCDRLEEVLMGKLDDTPVTVQEAVAPDVEAHVASEIYRSGGHTPLMRSLMQEGRRSVHAILTRPANAVEAAAILGLGSEQVTCVPAQMPAKEHILFLAQQFSRYSQLVLHIHPDDVACSVALRIAKRLRTDLRISFVNHADHVFSVATGVADHLFEVSAYGWMLREARGSLDRSSYIGIPILDTVGGAQSLPAADRYVLTGGAPYKFKPMGGLSLMPALERLLVASPELKLIIIGGSSRDRWWKGLIRKFGQRVQLIKTLPKEQYRRLLLGAALYVDSYPWIGGTAFPEALMLGLNVTGMRGLAWGYSAADELRSGDETEFVQFCLALLDQNQAALLRQQSVRQKCREHHDPAMVRSRMDYTLQMGQAVAPPPEQLENPPVPRIEFFWAQAGRSILPSKRRVELSARARRQISWAHGACLGWLNRASLKLLFYAWIH